ncbi:MAG: class I SAM-dependent methyltransferase [Chthoniobacteraceae bacterium]
MTAAFLDWNVHEDAANIVESAIELRKNNAETVYAPIFASAEHTRDYLASPRIVWRTRVLEKFEVFTGKPISGKVIEIGAGTGWCSAILSQRPHVEEVYALEYDRYCVETLMPMAHHAVGGREEKIRRVLGSFNLLKVGDGFFDLVVSIGALHHSENLRVTLGEAFRALKPGGHVIATELCEFNSFTQRENHAKRYTPIPAKQAETQLGVTGRSVTHAENSDHYFRLCEYEAAAFDAGFDVTSFVFDSTPASGGRLGLLARTAREFCLRDRMFTRPQPYRGFSRRVSYPYFARDSFSLKQSLYDRILLFLTKP